MALRRPAAGFRSPAVPRHSRGSFGQGRGGGRHRRRAARRLRGPDRAHHGPGLPGCAPPLSGRPPPRMARVGSPGHAMGRQPAPDRDVPIGRFTRRVRPGCRWPGRIDCAARMVGRGSHPLRLGSHGMVESVPVARRADAPCAGSDEGRVRRSRVGVRSNVVCVHPGWVDRGRREIRRTRPPDPRSARRFRRRGRDAIHGVRGPCRGLAWHRDDRRRAGGTHGRGAVRSGHACRGGDLAPLEWRRPRPRGHLHAGDDRLPLD